jgi:hypothetical protein
LLSKVALSSLSSRAVSASWASLAFWVSITIVAILAWVFDRFIFFPGIVLTEGLSTMWRGLTGLAALTFDVHIRNSVWGFIKSLSLGVNGAPQRVEDIAVKLMFDQSDQEDCVYLELPADVVSSVTAAQEARIAAIQKILYRKTTSWSPGSLHEQLEAVDFPLVHTTYYRDAECIEKIAAWVSEPMVKEFDGRFKTMTTVAQGRPHDGVQNVTLEEIESRNAYREHLEDLKQKFGPRGSRWGTGTNFDAWFRTRGPRGE